MSMRKGASVSQLLQLICGPRGLRILRSLSRRGRAVMAVLQLVALVFNHKAAQDTKRIEPAPHLEVAGSARRPSPRLRPLLPGATTPPGIPLTRCGDLRRRSFVAADNVPEAVGDIVALDVADGAHVAVA